MIYIFVKMGIKPLSNLDRISTRTAEFVLWGYIWIRPRLDFCCRRSIGLCDRFLSLVISNLWFCLWKDLWEKERDRKGRKEMLLHHWPISIPLPNAFIHWNPDLLLLCRLGTTLSYAWQHTDLLRTRGPRAGHFWQHWKWNGKTITNRFPICMQLATASFLPQSP